VPESKGRAKGADKVAARQERKQEKAHKSNENALKLAQSRNWAPYVFVPMFLIAVVWLVVYYIAGNQVPGMKQLGDWNFLISVGLIIAGFVTSTFWK
jgi:hypothetical protein